LHQLSCSINFATPTDFFKKTVAFQDLRLSHWRW